VARLELEHVIDVYILIAVIPPNDVKTQIRLELKYVCIGGVSSRLVVFFFLGGRSASALILK